MQPRHPIEHASIFHDGTTSRPQLNHPEGVAVAADGAVWCGGEAGEIYRISPDGATLELRAETDGFTLGLAFGPEGELYACDLRQRLVWRYDPASDRLTRFADGGGGIAIPNYPVVDAERGCLYVSDSHDPDRAGPGVWRFDLEAGSGGLWYDQPLRFANGMALSLDRAELLVAETFAHRISAIAIGDGGEAGGSRVVVEGLPGLPDGIALDEDGVLYVGCYEPSRVLRIEPGGEPEVLIEDETAHVLCHPTNLAFRDRELFTSNLGRWHVTRLEVETPGAPLLR